jgi:hypothetical protein
MQNYKNYRTHAIRRGIYLRKVKKNTHFFYELSIFNYVASDDEWEKDACICA